ncbi:MAG: hypothetical protein JXB04_05050 [Kiritimatiellae bacterium]|nr:hypothetical protein [Kiritimatiellia bacterium]
MDNTLIWLTGIVVLASMAVAYQRARDPLHPLMYFGPMLLYVFTLTPVMMLANPDVLASYFSEAGRLEMAQVYVLLAVTAFCLGCLRPRLPPGAVAGVRKPVQLTPVLRRRLLTAAFVLAAIGLGSYLFMTRMRGGILATYSAPKGRGWAPSGYITAAPLLTIPAVMLLFVGRQGQLSPWKTWAWATVFAAPHILHASFGARRGAAFLVLATIGFSWYLSTGRRPSWRTIVAGVGAAGLLMIFLVSQRSHIYVGSDFEFDQEAFTEALVPKEAGTGELVVYSWGMIIVADHTREYGWGRRYLIHGVVRPIPRQLWPTKYEDASRLLYGRTFTPEDAEERWSDALGWVPPAGSATGFVADSFAEFSWAGALLCYALGLFYGTLWKRAVLFKGFWAVLYLEAAAISVFMITQGVASSWLYRMVFLGVPTYLLWQALTRHDRRRQRGAAPGADGSARVARDGGRPASSATFGAMRQ